MVDQKSVAPRLPITQDLSRDYSISIAIALFMSVLSIVGIVFPPSIYPTEELQESFVANDLINLILGLPILLGSMWLARRGRLVGLLFWPGALFYDFYNYIAYLSGAPFSFFTTLYLAIILLCAFVFYDLLRKIDKKTVSEQLAGSVSEKLAGWILVLFGVAFIFRSIGMLTEAGVGEASLSAGEIGTLFADLALSTVWIAGGVLILRRKPIGYASGLGLLFAGSMLFIGLILILILQPILTGAAFVLTDVIVVTVMGLICFIPFGLYLRGVMSFYP